MFRENTYVVFDDVQKTAVLIDPGASTQSERQQLVDFLQAENLQVEGIWLTHSHIDHVLGLAWAVQTFACPYYQTAEDRENLRSVKAYASPMYGVTNYAEPDSDSVILEAHQQLMLGFHRFDVLPTPGHARGHVCFYAKDLGLIAGDALFNGSIGRTDLPGGDYPTLEKSIKQQLYTLPPETIVFPGHGPTTTIGHEKRFNPFVRA